MWLREIAAWNRRVPLLVLLGLSPLALLACVGEKRAAPPPAPSPAPTPPVAEALIDLATLQELRRLSLGDTAVIGPFEVTIREAAVRQNQVEVSLHLQPLTPAELEQRKQFNPFFLSVGGDRSTWVSLVIWRAGSGTFALVGPEGALCGADIQSDGQQPLRLQCRFRVPADAAPAYLLLSARKVGVTLLAPIVPLESLEHRAVIPLTPLPPALAGKVPDLPVPLGQPVRTPDGVEITVLDSTVTSEPLPVGNETGSVTLYGAPEGYKWRVVRLRLQCGRPDRCAISLGAFRVQRSDGSSSPPTLLGPPPYLYLDFDELIFSWQGQETLEFAFSAPASWPREMKDLPFPLGQPVRIVEGVEITLLDSRTTSESLPVVGEAGVVPVGAEGWEWHIVRLQLRCGRPDPCTILIPSFRARRSDGSFSPEAFSSYSSVLLGPPPYRQVESLLSWQGQETLELAFPVSTPGRLYDMLVWNRKLPDLSLPPGQPVQIPEGMEITLLDSRTTSESLPVVDETGSVQRVEPPKGEGWLPEWYIARLRLRCSRPDPCTVLLGSFRVKESDGSLSPPAFLGPPPYRDVPFLSWQGQETIELVFTLTGRVERLLWHDEPLNTYFSLSGP
ncbi:hypothetical protein [Thermoflexus sp.]|uniref:hypothetical protein n=1 Tax=Thermoflexus sp. TaxID=1969742 RepID=UPI003C1079F1